MAFARGLIALMLEEAGRRPFSGSVATLGKQTVPVPSEQLSQLFQKFSLTPKMAFGSGRQALDDQVFFKALGFAQVHSFDYSDYEGATYVYDLNSEKPPDSFVERYDVVFDSGTMEHIFHIPNVLRNIFRMTKVGGRVIFFSPCSNQVDHGLYMFSPTLFFDYYSANGFKIETLYVVRYTSDPDDLWDIYEYTPGTWHDLTGRLGDHLYAVFFVATKGPASTCDVIPQQGYYADTAPLYAGATVAGKHQGGGNGASISPGSMDSRNVGDGVKYMVKAAIKKIPGTISIVHYARLWATILGESWTLARGASYVNYRRCIGKKLINRY
jgi:hypothetical protein